MGIDVIPVPLEEILPFRELYRQEMACQIVHDSWHERGFADAYLLTVDGEIAGYGSVGGLESDPRNLVRELYLYPRRRSEAQRMFRALVDATGATRIEAQTNDVLLTMMLMDCVETVVRDRILFADAFETAHAVAGGTFRAITEDDRNGLFRPEVVPEGEWGVEVDGDIVATGGLMYHYNPPYSDLYIEVAPTRRRQGLGTFLVQELKRMSYEMDKIPAARCNADNFGSRGALQNAGMLPCGWILNGRIAG